MKETNEKKENRPWKLLELVLFLVSLVLFVVVFVANPTTTESGALDTYMYWIYVLVVFALLVTLAFPLIRSFKNKKSLVKLLLLIVAAVVIFGGAWLIAPGKPLDINAVVSDGTYKFADMALYVVYVFMGASIVALLWSALRGATKK